MGGRARGYRRGIDADELAEEFYQGVMRCHAAMGRTAEGMAAFRRLRQTLSVVLGVKPSQKSEQLMQLLGRPGRDRTRNEAETCSHEFSWNP